MDASDAPNVTSLSALAFSGLVAALVGWFDRRKARKEPVIQQGGEAQVVAASFVGSRQMDDLTTTMRGVQSEMITMNGLLTKMNERMHENEIVAAAVAKMREDRQ